jgi:DNA modification methylase
VLKPEGSIFVNLGDKYAGGGMGGHGDGIGAVCNGAARAQYRRPKIDAPAKSLLGLPWRYALGCMDQLGLILRAEIIWAKPNGLPESVTDRVRRSHEQVFHFTRSPRYYAAVDEIRTPHAQSTMTRGGGRNGLRISEQPNPSGTITEGRHDWEGGLNALGSLPGSVWSIPSQPLTVPPGLGVDHFAAFPAELPRRIILGWSPPGVCTGCGQGRRPVVDRNHADTPGGSTAAVNRLRADEIRSLTVRKMARGSIEATITGYACACTPFTDHPGTGERYFTETPPGGNRGRNTTSGAHIPHVARGDDGPIPKVGPWREYHFDRWTPPPTRPAIVVDPFGGTGTTALVASVLGRTGISFDLSHDYSRLARWRTQDPGERCRVIGAPKPPPVADGQDALFAL